MSGCPKINNSCAMLTTRHREGAHAMAMTALGELIESQRRVVGRGRPRSYQRIADIATEAGFPMSKSHVHNLATNPLEDNWPSPGMIRGLAKGLELPAPVVGQAVLASVGLSMTSSTRSPLVVSIEVEEQRMSDQQRKALEDTVQAFFRAVRPVESEG